MPLAASSGLFFWLLFVLVLNNVVQSTLAAAAAAAAAPPNVICVGGSSGMGKAAALEAVLHGGRVLLVSRNRTKLEAARREILEQADAAAAADCPPDSMVDICAVDCMDEAAVQQFAATQLEPGQHCWDCLVVSAAGPAAHGPVATLPVADARYMMDTKFWTAYACAKYVGPRLRDGGAVVLVAGVLNRRPGVNCAPLAIANGALEGLTRALALEWGPRLRVNCLSPGFCDTERFDRMDRHKKAQMLAHTAASLPLQRTGTARDMGQAIYYLLTAPFVTGTVLDVDGGHLIRQYANPTNDPMRASDDDDKQ